VLKVKEIKDASFDFDSDTVYSVQAIDNDYDQLARVMMIIIKDKITSKAYSVTFDFGELEERSKGNG
jgi:hypothetical protein